MNLGLGTAQFGLEYGVSNSAGAPNLQVVSEILELATQSGVEILDTAAAYGDAEQVLGQVGVDDFKVVTKFMPFCGSVPTIAELISEIQSSCLRLKTDKLHGVMFHRASDLLTFSIQDYQILLENIRDLNLVEKLGVSVYKVSELEKIVCRGYPFDLVQIPLNIIDRSFIKSGFLRKLKSLGIEIHVRSVFMQGLLLLDQVSRPTYFNKWREIFDEWERWISMRSGETKVGASLEFIRQVEYIDHVIVGVNTSAEFLEIFSAFNRPKIGYDFPNIESEDTNLIHPYNWELK